MTYVDLIEFIQNEKKKRLEELIRIYKMYYPY
jgi:hypothetical protein